MESKKNKLTKRDYFRTSLRSYILQNGFNYNTYQGVSYLNVILPGLKKIYKDDPEKLKETAKANLEFYNTSPHLVPFISNLQLAMYEDGQSIDTVRSIKMALMGPLAGIGDPVFWFTIRPILGAIAAGLAATGSIIGPLFFFIVWNLIRIAFMWSTQELGYRQGSEITKDLSGGVLQSITKVSSIVGMFVMGILVERWTTMKFPLVLTRVSLKPEQYIQLPGADDVVTGGQLGDIVTKLLGGKTLSPEAVTTLQDNLNKLIPGLAALLLTFFVMWLLKKNVKPIYIIFGLFALGILAGLTGVMAP